MSFLVVDDKGDNGDDDNRKSNASDDNGSFDLTGTFGKNGAVGTLGGRYVNSFYGVCGGFCGEDNFGSLWGFGTVDGDFFAGNVKLVAVAVNVLVGGVSIGELG